ncbi:MAG TPA: hypothetical protein VFW96_03010, partial [Thermomicrobiales bacterium]|nr:hypothetical protein [Thermomicrobiales bacterium]
MFEALEALQPVTFCDYFRVPYRVVAPDDSWHARLAERHPLRACGHLRARGADGATRALSWPRGADDAPAREHRVDGIPIFCRVVPDDVAR